MMKAVFVLAAFVMCVGLIDAGLIKEEAKEKWIELGKKCAAETGATEEDLTKLHKKELPETKNGKCLLACMYKDVGVIKDGKYSVDGALESLSKVFDGESSEIEKFKNIIKTCGEEVGEVADECELAAKIVECKMRALGDKPE